MQNAAAGAANSVKRRGKTASGQLSAEQAAIILDLPKDKLSPAEITKKYNHLLRANDPAKGGSPYIQAKVANAKSALEEAIKNKTI